MSRTPTNSVNFCFCARRTALFGLGWHIIIPCRVHKEVICFFEPHKSALFLSPHYSPSFKIMARLFFVALAAFLSLPHSFAGLVQKPDLSLPHDADTHRDAVKQIFVTSYDAYKFVRCFNSNCLIPENFYLGSTLGPMTIYYLKAKVRLGLNLVELSST